jgi:dTDP-4-dehydrorhamnose 3,5-epimerase
MSYSGTKASGAGIDGVKIVPKLKLFNDRGAVFHMLRKDDPEFTQFGEIYFSKVYAGVVKAWHLHSKMTLNYLVVVGSIRLALFDDRAGSPTRGKTQELFLEESDSKLIVIPPGIWNGFKGLGSTASIIANCATTPHTAEEITRRPYNDPYFKYDWAQTHG